MWLVWDTGKMHTGFWWGYLRDNDHLEDLGGDGRIILKMILEQWDGETWPGFIWLRLGKCGEVL